MRCILMRVGKISGKNIEIILKINVNPENSVLWLNLKLIC